jgi:Rod binding domain-containing protein
MTSPTQPIGTPPPRDDRADVRRLSNELEAVFIRQLFQAMRESNTKSGLLEQTPGDDFFSSMLDDRLASETAARMERGIGDALYKQLSGRLSNAGSADDN